MLSITDQLVRDRGERLLRLPKRHRAPDVQAPAVMAVRLDTPLHMALVARADAEAVPAKMVVDRALRAYLDVA